MEGVIQSVITIYCRFLSVDLHIGPFTTLMPVDSKITGVLVPKPTYSILDLSSNKAPTLLK